MAARLGNVLYWAFCGLAVIAFGLCAIAAENSPGEETFFLVLGAIVAGGSWLVGRALRYVLSAR